MLTHLLQKVLRGTAHVRGFAHIDASTSARAHLNLSRKPAGVGNRGEHHARLFGSFGYLGLPEESRAALPVMS